MLTCGWLIGGVIMAVLTTARTTAVTVAKAAVVALGIAGGLILLTGVGLWVYQIIYWLRYGSWFSIPATTILPIDQFAYMFYWVGVQKIILWFADLHLAIYCILFGIWTVGASFLLHEKYFEGDD